uniref:Uncharacterized protein n=1 Tax=Rhizophora mucronata TaxID=61149 RepID=A0A2P2PG05_RHIMU
MARRRGIVDAFGSAIMGGKHVDLSKMRDFNNHSLVVFW